MNTKASTADRVQKLAAEFFGVAIDQIDMSKTFEGCDASADSLDYVEFIMDIEDDFGLELLPEEADSLQDKPLSDWPAFIDTKVKP